MLGNTLVPKPWTIHSYLTLLGWETLTNVWVVRLSTLATMLSNQPLFNLKKIVWPDKAGYRAD